MNKSVMCKYLLSFVLVFNAVYAGVIKPENAQQHRDILVVSGNRSSYYLLKDESLVYKVKGPQRIKIYSRAALTHNGSKSNDFEFEIQLNGNQPLQAHHQQQVSKAVKSPEHPNHFYTKSARDYVNIPAGVNEITLRPKKKSNPVLIRIVEDAGGVKGKRKQVDALSEQSPVRLVSNGKAVSYYPLLKDHPLFVTMEGPANLEITTRLGYDPQMGEEEDYRLQILDNNHVLGTYYFSTSRSEETRVEGQLNLSTGKWRSCDIKLGKGMHEIKLKLLDEGRQVFVKLTQISGD